MKRFILILILLGCFLHQPAKALMTSIDPEGTPSAKSGWVPEEFKVFPNPVTHGKITVESSRQPLSELRISNIAGKPVYQKKVNQAVYRFEIPANDLPPGIYLLHIKATDNTSKTVKLLITNKP